MQRSVFIITLLFFCCYCTNSYAQKKIYWFTDSKLTSDQINQVTSAPLSTVADTTRLLMTALPQYKFNMTFAQSPSIARLLNKLPNSCSPNRIKTAERLKENIYSLPLNIALGLRLYFQETSQSYNLTKNVLNEDQQSISLPSLFTGKSSYTLGIEKGRSYGAFLDTEISSLEEHNLVVRSGGAATKSLVKMLLKDRIDYMIEYPVGIIETLKNFPTNITLNSLRIANSQDYNIGYVACHKGSLGQAIIEDINKELLKLYPSYPFYHAHIRYLDKTDLADFNQAYQEVFNVTIPLKNSQ